MRCVSTERIGRKKGFIDDDDWQKIEKKVKKIFRMYC